MIPQANLIPLFAAIPLGGAFLITLFGKRFKGIPDILGNAFTFILLNL